MSLEVERLGKGQSDLINSFSRDPLQMNMLLDLQMGFSNIYQSSVLGALVEFFVALPFLVEHMQIFLFNKTLFYKIWKPPKSTYIHHNIQATI